MASRLTATITAALAAALAMAGQSAAAPFAPRAPVPSLLDAQVVEIQRAIDEQRYVDAGQMLNRALLAGVADARLTLLTGNLSLVRGHPETALDQFKQVDTVAETRAQALQGEGIALSLLGRSDDALTVLKRAVAEDPQAWRAWNALGSEYDNRRDWTGAEAAYGHAIAVSTSTAIVLNNRGYSRLLQNRPDDAVADLVGALKKQPNLAVARTNLRFAMAMRGDYDRAIAGGGADERAAILNNAGYAAVLRGDYGRAEDLLGQAMKAKSEYYALASANLQLIHDLSPHPKTEAADAVR